MVRCNACHKRMSRGDWDVHRCPAIPRPVRGESYEAYAKRLEIANRIIKGRAVGTDYVVTRRPIDMSGIVAGPFATREEAEAWICREGAPLPSLQEQAVFNAIDHSFVARENIANSVCSACGYGRNRHKGER